MIRFSQKKKTLLTSSIAALILVFGFQNCREFSTVQTSNTTSSLNSTGPDLANGPNVIPQPVAISHPQIPVDNKSNLFDRMGVHFGPKNGSTCELAPPLIPEFNLPIDDSHVFKVCADSSCAYQTIQSAIDAAPIGSVVAVKAGDYNECLRLRHASVTLQGRGGRPHLFATNCPAAPFSGAIIALDADQLHIENFEISDPNINTQAAISAAQDSISFTLTNLYIHHAAAGLTTGQAGRMELSNIYLDNVGHQPNPNDAHVTPGLAPRGTEGIIRNSVEVRMRENSFGFSGSSEINTFDCVVVADLDTGLSSYELIFGAGQNTTVTNSVVQKGLLGDQKPFLYWNRAEIRKVLPTDQLTLTNTIFISDRAIRDRDILDLRLLAPSVVSGNTFIGPGSDTYGMFANSLVYLSRQLSGMPADLTFLPYPGSMAH